LKLIKSLDGKQYNGIILAVAHSSFEELNVKALKTQNSIVFDLKAYLDRNVVDARL